jgi:hypothetical protein
MIKIKATSGAPSRLIQDPENMGNLISSAPLWDLRRIENSETAKIAEPRRISMVRNPTSTATFRRFDASI